MISVLHACNFLLTLVSFVVVARRGKPSNDSSSLWFFRTRYGHPSRIPYIMPNPLAMFLAWNAIFTLLMQPYTWLNYFAWKYPSRAVTSKVYFWYGFVFIFDGAGMWMSAFGTLYATLLPRVLLGPEPKISPLLHPVLLNSLCFVMPLLLIITQFVTASLSQIAWSKLVNIQFDLIESLGVLSSQWIASNGTTIDQTLRKQVSTGGNEFMSAAAVSQDAFVRNAWAACTWYFLCMLLFAPTAIWLLITLRRAAAQLSQTSRTASAQTPTTPGPDGRSSSRRGLSFRVPLGTRNPAHESSRQRRQLQRAYVTAALQFVTTFICLGVAVGCFAWVSIDIHRVVTNPTIHAVAILISDWVFAIVGNFVNILIIIRMTSKVEPTGSHPSASQNSRHTHARSLSNARVVAENLPPSSDDEFEKPIPLNVISSHLHASESEAELGLGYKAPPLSSNGGHSSESLGYDRQNRF